MIDRIDTGKSSILHLIYPSVPTETFSTLKHAVLPYLSIASITFGGLLFLASYSFPTLTLPSSIIKVPFLLDFNTIWMFVFTLPLMTTLIVTERIVLPLSLGELQKSGVLTITQNDLNTIISKWEARYRYINIISQIVGLIISTLNCITNFLTFTQPGYGSWHSINGEVFPVSWYSLFCLFIFYFIASVYIFRAFSLIFFLRDLVSHSTIQIIPFYPDKCGGLKSVGNLGLRNQYFLSAAGINVLLLGINFIVINSQAQLQTQLIPAAIIYIIFGPISFLGPLLPFRNAMQHDKSELVLMIGKKIKKEFDQSIRNIEKKRISNEVQEKLNQYKILGETIEKLPVWPFDTSTLTKFFSAYMLPLITGIVSFYLQNIIMNIFSRP
jgi:hypothetical protein